MIMRLNPFQDLAHKVDQHLSIVTFLDKDWAYGVGSKW